MPGQCGEQRIGGTLVAAQETADDSCALGAAATELIDQRQLRRRASERRHVRRRPHPWRARQEVCIALGENDAVSLLQTDGFPADRLSKALAPCDEVVFDDALGPWHPPRPYTTAFEAVSRGASQGLEADGPPASACGPQPYRDNSLPDASPTSSLSRGWGCCFRWPSIARRKAWRARDRLDMTVPMGMPSTAASSW